nr:DUF4118 domain-containing protein [Methylomonas koyamae]
MITAAGYLLLGRLEPANLIMVYLLGVIFVASRFGRGPSVLASVLGVAASTYCSCSPTTAFRWPTASI